MIKDFKIPTTQIDLLSGGKLYKDIPSTLEVENMVTKDEDLLFSNSRLESGDIFKRLVQQKIKTPNVNVNDLLIGDFNQLLIHIRCSGYGSDYEINTYDSDLDKYVPKTIDLGKLGHKKLGEDYNENGEFTITLPVSKSVLTFNIPTVGIGDIVNKEAESNKDINGVVPHITTRLKYLITSVDGDSDKVKIKYFVESMSPRDRLAISKKIDEVEPDVLLKWEFETEKTKTKYETDIMLGLDFFFPQN